MTVARKARGPIRGKVARILNSHELVINRGFQNGVTVGMRFAVLDPKAEDIKDPDTGEVLGSIYRPKIEVEVTRVEARLALANTFKTKTVNVGGAGMGGLQGISSLFEPPKWVTQHESLKTDESTWEDLDETQSFVKTGDPIEQVIVFSDAEGELTKATSE